MDGEGRFKDIIIAVGYGITPATVGYVLATLLSRVIADNEELKPLQYALQQITAGGTARAGAAAAVTFIIATVPIIFFLICQSNVLETMTTSGMKD